MSSKWGINAALFDYINRKYDWCKSTTLIQVHKLNEIVLLWNKMFSKSLRFLVFWVLEEILRGGLFSESNISCVITDCHLNFISWGDLFGKSTKANMVSKENFEKLPCSVKAKNCFRRSLSNKDIKPTLCLWWVLTNSWQEYFKDVWELWQGSAVMKCHHFNMRYFKDIRVVTT